MPMECRYFDITLISAANLEDVRKSFQMEVHARVTVGSGDDGEKRTPRDKHGGTNPAWNYTMRFVIRETMLTNSNGTLGVKLYCTRKLGDRYVGEVHTPMKDLFVNARPTGGSAVVSFRVQKGCVDSQGTLWFSYMFSERVIIENM